MPSNIFNAFIKTIRQKIVKKNEKLNKSICLSNIKKFKLLIINPLFDKKNGTNISVKRNILFKGDKLSLSSIYPIK